MNTESTMNMQTSLPQTDKMTVSATTALPQTGDRLSMENETIKIQVNDLKLYYGNDQALKGIDLVIPERKVTAFIGPSGCGKSTLLRCFNRMNDLVDICKITGEVIIGGKNIYDRDVDVAELRRNVGMVFQKPNPFPKTIYENVAYGLRLQGVRSKRVLDETVEQSLRSAALWDEVKDRLHDNAFGMSGGQQQGRVMPGPLPFRLRYWRWMSLLRHLTPIPPWRI